MRQVLIAMMALVAMAGCGTSDDRAEARAVVERFYDAVRHDRGEVACAQLTAAAASAVASQSDEACSVAITQLEYEGGAIVRAQVFVTGARVELRSGEAAYLDHGPEGWRISAVACRPEQGPPDEVPMECEAEA
jgi:hypothetical protein